MASWATCRPTRRSQDGPGSYGISACIMLAHMGRAMMFPILPARPFALPRAYGAPVFPLPCLAGEPVRGRR